MDVGSGRDGFSYERNLSCGEWLWQPNLKNFQLNVMELIMAMSVITDTHLPTQSVSQYS